MLVSNSTPLIAFARIGELDLLRRIVGHVVIPTAVSRFSDRFLRTLLSQIREGSSLD
jgi:predicted nucleic acid-binding protein